MTAIPGFPAIPQTAPVQPTVAVPVAQTQAYTIQGPPQPFGIPQQPQVVPAPPQQAQPTDMSVLAAQIAGGEMGGERLPPVPLGNHVLKIIETQKPERTVALVTSFEIVQSDSAMIGMRCKDYQQLDGGPNGKTEVQYKAVLNLFVRACGFDTQEEAAANGYGQAQLTELLTASFIKPGPFAGRYLTCSTTNGSTGVNKKTGAPVQYTNNSFGVYRPEAAA